MVSCLGGLPPVPPPLPANQPSCQDQLCTAHLADTVSPVIAGCRTEQEDLFCVCPSSPLNPFDLQLKFHQLKSSSALRNRIRLKMSNSTLVESKAMAGLELDVTQPPPAADSSSGLSGGAIAGIVLGVLAALLVAAVVGFFLFRYLRDRRRNHGEYRPQFEEQHHAKDLPYLQPPAVEGLI